MFLSKKTLILFVIIFNIILLSGCVKEPAVPSNDLPAGNNSVDHDLDTMVMIEDLPSGYEYFGSLPISEYDDLSEKIISSKEGAYRDKENYDVFFDIIELDSASDGIDFIIAYKAQFIELPTGDRFKTVIFNGHDSTRIVTYRNQLPKYQYIWRSDELVFIVRSNSNNENSALELAKATGY